MPWMKNDSKTAHELLASVPRENLHPSQVLLTEPLLARDEYITLLREALAKTWGAPLEDANSKDFVDMRQTRWNRGPDRADLKYIPGVVVLLHYPRPPG